MLAVLSHIGCPHPESTTCNADTRHSIIDPLKRQTYPIFFGLVRDRRSAEDHSLVLYVAALEQQKSTRRRPSRPNPKSAEWGRDSLATIDDDDEGDGVRDTASVITAVDARHGHGVHPPGCRPRLADGPWLTQTHCSRTTACHWFVGHGLAERQRLHQAVPSSFFPLDNPPTHLRTAWSGLHDRRGGRALHVHRAQRSVVHLGATGCRPILPWWTPAQSRN